MRFIPIIVALILIAGCSKHDDLSSKDSLLVAPHTEPPVPQPKSNSEGLIIDSFVARQQPEMNTLIRLEPKQVVAIFEAYRPLRNDETTQAQLDSFLRVEKISEKELHAVLIEGDRLGWAGAKSH